MKQRIGFWKDKQIWQNLSRLRKMTKRCQKIQKWNQRHSNHHKNTKDQKRLLWKIAHQQTG